MNKHRTSLYGLLAAVLLVAAIGAFVVSSRSTTAQQTSTRNVAPQAPEAIAEAPATNLANAVMQERFDARPTNWVQFDQTLTPEDRGVWEVRAAKLAAIDNQGDPLGETMFLAPNPFTEGVVAAQFYPQGNQTIGLVFNYADGGYDLFRVFAGDVDLPHRYMLQHFDPNTGYTTLADVAEGPGYALNEWQELRVEQRDGAVICYFKGEPVIKVEQTTTAKGQTGVYTTAMGDVLFDNFEIAR